MDVEKIPEDCGIWAEQGSKVNNPGGETAMPKRSALGRDDDVAVTSPMGSRPKHRYSSSVDVAFAEIAEAKKAMPPEKLAELAAVDPKRAKRFFKYI